MTRRKVIASIVPRILSAPEVAAYLGHSPTWFYEHRDKLFAQGFPRSVPILNGWDRQAVDDWLASTTENRGVSTPTDARRAWESAANG